MASSTLPHIFLIGATGRTGRLIIKEAISRGHKITALARDPASLDSTISELKEANHNKIRIVKGTPTSQDDLTSALKASVSNAGIAQIVIVSTLGQTRKSGNPWAATTSPPLFMTQSIEALLSAITSLDASSKAKFEKVVVMSAFGTAESFKNLNCLLKPVMVYSNMDQTIEDHTAIDKVMKAQRDVKYVLVRASMLKDADALPVVVKGEDGKGEGWMPSSVTTGSVVNFMLDMTVSNEWDWKTPVIAN